MAAINNNNLEIVLEFIYADTCQLYDNLINLKQVCDNINKSKLPAELKNQMYDLACRLNKLNRAYISVSDIILNNQMYQNAHDKKMSDSLNLANSIMIQYEQDNLQVIAL